MMCVFNPKDLYRDKGKTCKKCGSYIGGGLFNWCKKCDNDIHAEITAAVRQLQDQKKPPRATPTPPFFAL